MQKEPCKFCRFNAFNLCLLISIVVVFIFGMGWHCEKIRGYENATASAHSEYTKQVDLDNYKNVKTLTLESDIIGVLLFKWPYAFAPACTFSWDKSSIKYFCLAREE